MANWRTSTGGGLTVLTEATTIATVSTAEELDAAIIQALSYKNYGAQLDGISPFPQIVVSDGAEITANSLSGVDLSHVTITGSTPVELAMTSVQSSTGSSGSYSVVVNVPALVAGDGLVVGQKVAGIGAWSGGTNAYLFKAVSTITNVDLVNKRITFAIRTKSTTAAPSGACAGTLRIWKSSVAFPFMLNSSIGVVSDLAIGGISLIFNASVKVSETCGAFDSLYAISGSRLHCDMVVFGECSSGVAVSASYNSTAHADNIMAGNFTVPTTARAVISTSSSHVSSDASEIYGCDDGALAKEGGSIYLNSAVIRDCITACSVLNLGVIQVATATFATNTANYSQTADTLTAAGLISTT